MYLLLHLDLDLEAMKEIATDDDIVHEVMREEMIVMMIVVVGKIKEMKKDTGKADHLE